MAAPVFHASTAFIGNGTSVSIPATATSPVTGDYRVMVVHTNDHHTSGQPTTVTSPAGWTFLYQSPRGRSTIRTWVYGQPWTPAVATGNLTLSSNLYYAVILGRMSGFTQGVVHPMVTTPASVFGGGTSLAAGTLNTQGDSLRLDIWVGFYALNANSVATVINVPAGQTGEPIVRSPTTQGYVARLTHETRANAGFTGQRTATMTVSNVNAVVSLAIGGWKVVNGNTTTALATSSAQSGSKAVTLGTDSEMALASSAEGSGHSVSVSTDTALALSSTSQRVYLTHTALDLTSTSIGGHHSTGEPTTALALVSDVAGTHTAEPVDTATKLDLINEVVARVGGGGPTSVVDQYTVQYVPSVKPLRFMLQNARTGTWNNWDFPLVEPEISYTLSGATIIRGRIGPEDYPAIGSGVLDAWGTWLHVEEGGQIRGSALMQPFALQGDDLLIEAAGPHAYAIGTQFESELSRIQIDAAEAMRELWRYLQSYTDSKLGVTLDATNTGRLLGDPERIEITRDTNGAIVWRVLNTEPEDGAFRVPQSSIPASAWDKLVLWGYPIYINIDTNELVLYVHPSDYAMATVGMQGRVNAEGKWEVPEFTHQAAKPYEIAWWNEIDVGREIENLAKQTPFDFAETPRWKQGRLDVQQHISIGYPRLGTKRLDLRFAEDENLLEAVLIRETPGHYASQVILRGAGEGRSAIRSQAGGNNPNRFRRVASLTDKTITDRTRAYALARDELFRRVVSQTIGEITIMANHDNAPMGSFALGDDILVRAKLPYFGEIAWWHRIIGYTWRPDADLVTLNLRRSEQFAYGRIVPT